MLINDLFISSFAKRFTNEVCCRCVDMLEQDYTFSFPKHAPTFCISVQTFMFTVNTGDEVIFRIPANCSNGYLLRKRFGAVLAEIDKYVF